MIEARVDVRSIERDIDELVRRGDRAGPILRELARPMRQDQREHARARRGPEARWSSLAPSTRRKRRRRRRLLGRLPAAVTYRASADELRARSRAYWSSVHQTGGRVGRGARLPARPFLWLSEAFLRDAVEAFLDYVSRVWGRR